MLRRSRLTGWRALCLLLAIYVANEGLFAGTNGSWGPGYVLLREAVLPLLCLVHIVVTVVGVVLEKSWVRRSTMAASVLGSGGLIYLQWIWQGSLFLHAP